MLRTGSLHTHTHTHTQSYTFMYIFVYNKKSCFEFSCYLCVDVKLLAENTCHINYGSYIHLARLITGWTIRRSNPGRCEIFRTRPDLPWGPPSLLYNGYQVFPGGKAAETWRWPPSVEVKERIELCLYSPSEPSWPVLGWTLSYMRLAALPIHASW